MPAARTRTRLALAAAAALATAGGLAAAPATAAGGGPGWETAWAGSPVTGNLGTDTCPSDRGLTGQTVRNSVTTAADGNRIRVRLSNTFGARAVTVGHATVARQTAGAAVDPGSLRGLTFSGRKTVDIPAGAEVFSDPVTLDVHTLGHLAVSVYVPGSTGPVTNHNLGTQDSYLSAPSSGDRTADTGAAAYPSAVSCQMLVDGVDVVRNRTADGTVATLGDSITDGYLSTYGADHRWPNYLTRRLQSLHGPVPVLANTAISGNQVTLDRDPVNFGTSALHRLDRDVLNQSGVRAIILLEGINDIGASSVPASKIIDGYREIIARAHARGLPVYGGTLVPFGGSNAQYGYDYGTAWGEQQRLAVNDWIRTSGAFDAVIDFDKTVRDPADPSRMKPEYDSGDHLHPGDAGYSAMADTVPLDLLTKAAARHGA